MKPIQRIIDDYCRSNRISKEMIFVRKRRKPRYSNARRQIIRLAAREGHKVIDIAYAMGLAHSNVIYHLNHS